MCYQLSQIKEDNVWHAEVLGSELYLVDLDGTAKRNRLLSMPILGRTSLLQAHCCSRTLFTIETTFSYHAERSKNDRTNEKTSEGELLTKGFARLKGKTSTKSLQPLVIDYHVEQIETNQYHPELSILAVYLRVGFLETPKKTYIVKIFMNFYRRIQKKKLYGQ